MRRVGSRVNIVVMFTRTANNRLRSAWSGCLLSLWLSTGLLFAQRQEESFDLNEMLRGVATWAQENLDTNRLSALPKLDAKQARQWLRDFQQRFSGEYVVNLAAFRGTAETILPFLQSYSETKPYAAWLKPRLDYLIVAEEFSFSIPPPKKGDSDQTPNPTPQQQRDVWTKQVNVTPWPPAASNYVSQLKPIFTAAGVPAELVWIAEVESAFDPSASSPVGAAGLFQLMPETAKRFGLNTWPRDQRYQPEPSARASAQYLKFLYGKFKDWRLAIAAYNAGEGRVQRLLTKYNAQSYDDIATYLPAETQMYVPKVEAIIAKREGVNLTSLGIARQ